MPSSETNSDSIALAWLASCIRGEQPHWPDWQDASIADHIWQAGLEHGVLALCSHYIFGTPAQTLVTPDFQQRLKDYVRQAAVRELVQEHEIKQVLKLLHKEGISFLVMKGTSLAYSIYPQPYLRSRYDTDLLFQDKAAAERAWHVLQDRGYTRPNAVSGKFVSHEFSCYKSGKTAVPHVLDLHWKLSNNQFFAQSLSFNELQADAITVSNLGKTVLAFNRIHGLLHACMHRIAHKAEGNADRLIWLYDIHLLAKSLNQTQWARFVVLAVANEICNICLDGFQKTESVFATAIPTNVINVLQEMGKKEAITEDMGTTLWRNDLANFQALPAWRDRLQLLKEHVFPDSDYMLKKYNTNNRYLLPLLYIRRAARGISKRLL